jgi:hypothetical protein
MTRNMPDPVIDEIREVRHRISEICDHDPRKLVAYFQEIQRQHSDRLIALPQRADDDSAPRLTHPGPPTTTLVREA